MNLWVGAGVVDELAESDWVVGWREGGDEAEECGKGWGDEALGHGGV